MPITAGHRFQRDYFAGVEVVDRFEHYQLAIVHRMLQHFAAGDHIIRALANIFLDRSFGEFIGVGVRLRPHDSGHNLVHDGLQISGWHFVA